MPEKIIKRNVGTKNRLTLPNPFNVGDLIELELSEEFIQGKTNEFKARRLYASPNQ